jgi:hypothetical protein
MNEDITTADLEHLVAASEGRYGLDLRFEGGPWISELDALVDRGLFGRSTGSMDYMVNYFLTPAGREALAKGRPPT